MFSSFISILSVCPLIRGKFRRGFYMQKRNEEILNGLIYDKDGIIVGFSYRYLAPNGVCCVVLNMTEKAWNEFELIDKKLFKKNKMK